MILAISALSLFILMICTYGLYCQHYYNPGKIAKELQKEFYATCDIIKGDDMIIKERNLDGEIVEREIDTVTELKYKIMELEKENRDLDLTLSLVTTKELSTIRTEDLIMELQLRMGEHIKKARKYDKLKVKHKKAAALIAELKNNNVNEFYIEDEHIKDKNGLFKPFYVDTFAEAKRLCDWLNGDFDE